MVRLGPEEPSLWSFLSLEMCPHLFKKAKIEPSPNGNLWYTEKKEGAIWNLNLRKNLDSVSCVCH